MESLYPQGPAVVPEQLTAPSSNYRRNAWLAMLGLGGFIAVYLGLLVWFGWTAYRLVAGLLQGSGGEQAFWQWVVAAGAAFLAVFMAKALVFNKRAERDTRALELTPAEQPALFAFLYRLADDAGAPRPHKVYLSAQVNAGVFYDLSLINLLLPSRKNLDIGLGLVNVLNLGELKAVLAHEFGHFAQRTMAVGRWVYIAQQIAAHIVGKRDALDRILATLSRIDLRVAWIGWGLSLIVWSIRSLVEIAFRGVVLAQRALSREMEYQADLVAASLTGSDALVHALHKLEAADDGFQRALRFAAREFAQDRPVKDLFAIQSRIIEHMRVVLNDPGHGAVPAVPTETAPMHRLFHGEIAQPSQMWPRIRPAPHARRISSAATSPAPSMRARPWSCCMTPRRCVNASRWACSTARRPPAWTLPFRWSSWNATSPRCRCRGATKGCTSGVRVRARRAPWTSCMPHRCRPATCCRHWTACTCPTMARRSNSCASASANAPPCKACWMAGCAPLAGW